MTMSRDRIQEALGAQELLFLGVVPLDVEEDYRRYQAWLAEGRQAGMHFLENYPELRRDPRGLLPGSQSAIVFALPYALGEKPGGPQVAQYARFRDYHRVLWERGENVARDLWGTNYSLYARVTVDSAPLLERALAASSARGFIGKNTCYIHPDLGSFLLLGEILTTEPIERDVRVSPREFAAKSREGGCGPCKICQVACPTGALDKDYQIDARKCLSYWTIEHRGAIPVEYWPHLAEYFFGCDICQTTCPYNVKGPRRLPASLALTEIPTLHAIATMGEAEYKTYFSGTSLTRAKRSGLRRNALIAMFVTEDPRLASALGAADTDEEEPVAETRDRIRQLLREGKKIFPSRKNSDLDLFPGGAGAPTA